MENLTDRPLGLARDVTGEHASKAALVLAGVARTLAVEDPKSSVNAMEFTVLVGARAYERGGRSCHGGGVSVSRTALRAVGQVPADVAREVFAVTVAEAARTLGYDWSGVQGEWDDNERAIPKHPVPGPRRTDESGRVPAPRRAQAVAR
ncbi:hypothetical protein ACIP2X_18810 [Streptomyces sp. NPDC089424]|uniref:hypothetical protein n=1 Tax=Streptomyces sp. NPDC089424 TaxID=3365917 RepID=UPI0038293515